MSDRNLERFLSDLVTKARSTTSLIAKSHSSNSTALLGSLEYTERLREISKLNAHFPNSEIPSKVQNLLNFLGYTQTLEQELCLGKIQASEYAEALSQLISSIEIQFSIGNS